MRRRLTLATLLLLAGAAVAQEAPFERVDGTATDLWLSGHQVADLDGDGRDEIVLIGSAGRVRVVRREKAGTLGEPRGELVLPHPARSLVGLGRVGDDERMHLIVASPDGVQAYPAIPGEGFAIRPLRLASRARFGLRVGARFLLTDKVELNGTLDYVSLEDDDTIITIGGRYSFTEMFSLGLSFYTADETDADVFGVDFRVNF